MKGAIAYLESKHIESVFEWVYFSFKNKTNYVYLNLECSKCQQTANERGEEKRRESSFKPIAKEAQRISTRARREYETHWNEEKGFQLNFIFLAIK